LLPWEYERLTPAELVRYVTAYREREEEQWRRVAFMVSHILGAWGIKRSVNELLGYTKDA
jgi:hypothetical protein